VGELWTRVMIRCQSGKLTDPALPAVIMNTNSVRRALCAGPTYSRALHTAMDESKSGVPDEVAAQRLVNTPTHHVERQQSWTGHGLHYAYDQVSGAALRGDPVQVRSLVLVGCITACVLVHPGVCLGMGPDHPCRHGIQRAGAT